MKQTHCFEIIVSIIVAIVLVLVSPVSHVSAKTNEPAKMHQVSADGHPLAVWEKLPANPKATVLLLHGRTWSSIPDFDLQVSGEELSLMDGLTAKGYAVYALDARGYGKTPRDETGWLTPDRAAQDVSIVLGWIAERHPALAPPVLFGWSYGSMVSQLTVQRNPKLVSAVVLFGYPTDPDTKAFPLNTPSKPPRKVNTAKAAASDFIAPGTISPKAVDAYVKACLAADPVRVDWRNLAEWNELDPAKVTVPILLMQGEFDPLAKPDAHVRLFTRLGTADRQWVVIPGGDHAAFLETPRPLFLHVLCAFVARWEK